MLAYSRQRWCSAARAAASKSFYQGRHEQKKKLAEGGCWLLELARSYTWSSSSQRPVSPFSRPMLLVTMRGAKRGATPSKLSHPKNRHNQHPDVNSTSDLFVRWEVPWGGKRLVITLAALAGSSISSALVAPIGLLASGHNSGSPLNADFIAVMLCSALLWQTLFGLFVMKACCKRYSPLPKELFSYDWRNPFSARRGWFFWGLVGLFCTVVAVAPVSLITNREGFSMKSDLLLQVSSVLGASGTSTALLLFSAGVLAPLYEETIFRGFLLTSLTKWLPTSAAVLISAGAFSLAHLNPGKSPIIFVFGIVLGFSYLKTGNLLTPIMIHGVWNSAVLLTLLFLYRRGVDIRKMLESPEEAIRLLKDQVAASSEKK